MGTGQRITGSGVSTQTKEEIEADAQPVGSHSGCRVLGGIDDTNGLTAMASPLNPNKNYIDGALDATCGAWFRQNAPDEPAFASPIASMRLR